MAQPGGGTYLLQPGGSTCYSLVEVRPGGSTCKGLVEVPATAWWKYGLVEVPATACGKYLLQPGGSTCHSLVEVPATAWWKCLLHPLTHVKWGNLSPSPWPPDLRLPYQQVHADILTSMRVCIFSGAICTGQAVAANFCPL